MNTTTTITLFVQLLSGIIVLVMCHWIAMPRLSLVAIGILLAEQAWVALVKRVSIKQIFVVWLCALLIPASYLLAKNNNFVLDVYFSFIAWLVAAGIFSGYLRLEDQLSKTRWRTLGMSWVLIGNLGYVVNYYVRNETIPFYIGLFLLLGWLITYKVWLRPGLIQIHIINSGILLIIGLPVCDLLTRPTYNIEAHPDVAKKYYSYAVAKRDPEAFQQWWEFYQNQLHLLFCQICESDREGRLPFSLRPGSRGRLFDSEITINSKGFRGREIPDEKGNTYRIVALGESTTFGLTMEAEGKPWPELLEQKIQTQLNPPRPVQVINAGTPGHHLKQNLMRWDSWILPLKPDLVISYHGLNGFRLLYSPGCIPHEQNPPAYQERSLQLLARVEYRLKMTWFNWGNVARLSRLPTPDQALATDYARYYRDLIGRCQTNHIRLVLATYSMAVNRQSDNDVVAFYRLGFPAVYWLIRANEIHTMIVRQLVAQSSGVDFVDTHPGLDGEHEKFVDVMHFTRAGEEQIAENIFAGIKDVLMKDWAKTSDFHSAQ